MLDLYQPIPQQTLRIFAQYGAELHCGGECVLSENRPIEFWLTCRICCLHVTRPALTSRQGREKAVVPDPTGSKQIASPPQSISRSRVTHTFQRHVAVFQQGRSNHSGAALLISGGNDGVQKMMGKLLAMGPLTAPAYAQQSHTTGAAPPSQAQTLTPSSRIRPSDLRLLGLTVRRTTGRHIGER